MTSSVTRRALLPLELALVISAMALCRTASADVEHTYQSWAAGFVQARLGREASSPGFWLDLHSRRAEGATSWLFRPGFGWYFGRSISLWAGYLLNPTLRDGAPDAYEHRPWEQLQVVFTAGTTVWTVRTRLEQRLMQEDSDLGWRARQLLRLQHSVGEEIALVVWDEVFVGLNETSWGQPSGLDQNRAFLGPAWMVRDGVRLEGGYLSVLLRRPGVTTVVHALSLNGFLSW